MGIACIGHERFGGFSTHICVGAARCLKIPDDMPFDEASCLVLTYGTSHHALKDRANIQAGETLLILGAAGGVGAACTGLIKTSGNPVRRFPMKCGLAWAILKNAANPSSGVPAERKASPAAC